MSHHTDHNDTVTCTHVFIVNVYIVCAEKCAFFVFSLIREFRTIVVMHTLAVRVANHTAQQNYQQSREV